MDEAVRERIEKAAASVLGGGDTVEIERDDIRPEYVKRAIAAWLESWGHDKNAVVVGETPSGGVVIGRLPNPAQVVGAALGRKGDDINRSRRSPR